MIAILGGRVEQYCSIMQDFLSAKRGNADLLQQAYEFGKDAIADNLSIRDITSIHKQALSNILPRYADAIIMGQVAIAATDLLTQSLLPIEELRQQESSTTVICDVSGKESLHWIYNQSSNLNGANTLDEIYHVALQGIQQILRTKHAAILMFDDRGVPRYQASTGISEAYKQAVENYCESLSEIPQTELVIVPDTALQPGVELLDTMRKAEDIKAAASFPIKYQGRQLGKIAVYYDAPHQFSDEEIQIVQSISSYTSVAITRKQTEIALLESQRFVQSIADSMPDILYVYDTIEQRNIYISEACSRILGYTSEELQAMSSDFFSQLMHPDDLALLFEDVERLHNMKTGEVIEREYRMKHADGRWKWLYSRDTLFLKDADGRTKQIVGIAQDISDRMDNEHKLRQQLAAMEASADGIAIVDGNGIFTYSNNAHAKIFGCDSAEEMIGKSWEDFYDREVVDYVKSTVVPIILAKGTWQGELIGNKKDGSHFPVEVSITSIAGGNGVCIYRDISDRKRVEAENRETQKRFQSILDNCPGAIYVFDKEGKHLLANRYYEQKASLTNAELYGKSVFEVWSHDVSVRTVAVNDQVIESGIPVELEEEIPHPDGLHTYVTLRFPLFNEQGIAYAACGISTDITARKLAEEKLFKTQQFLQSILDNFPGAINVFDRDDKHILVNYHVEKVLSQTNTELCGKSIHELLLPDFAARVSAENKQVFESGTPIELEGFVPQSDGLHTYVTNKFPLFNEQGIPYAVCGISTDITERKRAEVELHKTQQLLQSILDNFPGAIYVLDKEDRHVLVNRHVEKILSQTNAELSGKSLLEVLPPDFAARISALNKQVFESNMPLELEAVVPQDDGLHTYVTMRFPLFNELDLAYAVCGISLDITDRKLAEMQLQESLREKELLLKEIHHRVKNNLQVVASLLNLQKRTIADPAIAQLFEDSKNRVYSMAMIHERLYQSKQLNQVNLGKYLQDLVNELAQSNGIKSKHIHFQVDADAIDVNIETAMPCGLIVNELVTNAIKYAFPDCARGQVLLECRRTSDGQILLTVRDTGVGIPAHIDLKKATSLGLRITTNLAHQLKGAVEIDVSNGTCFSLKFAELAYQNRI
jgi:PAS domain S-box-containing protein